MLDIHGLICNTGHFNHQVVHLSINKSTSYLLKVLVIFDDHFGKYSDCDDSSDFDDFNDLEHSKEFDNLVDFDLKIVKI